MSAQIIAFPAAPRYVANRMRNIRDAITARADAVNANSDQRLLALAAALDAIKEGKSAYNALSEAYKQMPPTPRAGSFRPDPPEAA